MVSIGCAKCLKSKVLLEFPDPEGAYAIFLSYDSDKTLLVCKTCVAKAKAKPSKNKVL
jgi:hypothetical protein